MGDKKIVVVQLSGGNDYLNCIVPYNNPHYVDNRPNVRITEDRVIPIGGGLGMNPVMQPIKELYDEGKVAIIHGVGYPEPNRSHFRSMDIWHTAEPTKVGNEGWFSLRKSARALRVSEAPSNLFSSSLSKVIATCKSSLLFPVTLILSP